MALYLNQLQIPIKKFPGGELNIKVPAWNGFVVQDIWTRLYTTEDLFGLALLVDALRRSALQTKLQLRLHVFYMPYARQDRVCNPGESLAVKVAADFLNSLDFDAVFMYDPHSDVAPALVNNCRVVSQFTLISESPLWKELSTNPFALIVSPDAGAEKKVNTLAAKLKGIVPVVYATKKRNLATGEITGTEVHGDVAERDCYIIDDICDGGRTFIELAKVLKARGALSCSLWVTHGIFSQGLEPLKEHFSRVFCYHTYLTTFDSSFLKVVAIPEN